MTPYFDSTATLERSQAQRGFLREVFAWMFAALAVTTVVAIWFSRTDAIVNYVGTHHAIFFAAMIAQVGLVFVISGALQRLSTRTAAFLFFIYAAVTGVFFSILLDVYTTGSIVGAFAGAAGVFAGMAIWGYTTDRDLSSWRGVLFGALIGLIVASLVFFWIGGPAFNLILGWAGVIIFSGLTAYDMQQLERIRVGMGGQIASERLAIFGALRLYLDFINLFISLLRIFGNTR